MTIHLKGKFNASFEVLPTQPLAGGGSGTGGTGGGGFGTPDTTPPTIAFTSPAPAAVITGTVIVTGTVADNVDIDNVTISVDGSAFHYVTLNGNGTWQYSLDTSLFPTGLCTLLVTATDTSGNTATANENVSIGAGGIVGAGTLFWRGDLETCDLSQFNVHTGMPFWGNSSATVVQQGSLVSGLYGGDGPWVAPAPHTGRCAVALLVDGPVVDVGTAGGQRAELNSGFFAAVGEERWYGLSVYIPTAPNIGPGGLTMFNNAIWEIGWGTSLSLKTSEAGSSTGYPNAFLFANGAATSAQKNGWSSAYYYLAPVLLDQWVNFTIHVLWATDGTGYFEIYMNGVLVTMTGISVPSFSATRENGPNFGVPSQMVSEFDWYRGPSNLPNLLYLDDMKIGDTFAVVQPG